MNPIYFNYTFAFENGKEETFPIRLERETLRYFPGEPHKPADWARLENSKCLNCTLDETAFPFCPVAANIDNLLAYFEDMNSYEPVQVTVETRERTYSADTTIQLGLSSILGIFMVSTGCPVLGKLKPMVRFHLPFASVEETVFRSVSTYLVGQYMKHRKGENPDWELTGLRKNYEEIQIVNRGMADRLRSKATKDANINALIVLDVFAQELPYSIDKHLSLISYLFEDSR